MLKTFLAWLFGSRTKANPAEANPAESTPTTVGSPAPRRSGQAPEAPAGNKALVGRSVLLCGDSVLDRGRRVAGYHFHLTHAGAQAGRGAALARAHARAEVLLQRLVSAEVGVLLKKRFAFVDIPWSFLENPLLTKLPADRFVLMLSVVPDEAAPDPQALSVMVADLHARGFQIAIPDPVKVPQLASLLTLADLVVLNAPALDAHTGLQISSMILESAPQARLLVRNIPSLEDFRFCFGIGASLFLGRFINSREDWSGRHLSANTMRVAQIIGRLRGGAEIHELAQLLKQDPMLSVRLLRYINAAANGMSEQVSSIERALMLLGRERLYRWLALLVCSSGGTGDSGGTSAALESALVRARTMEMLAQDRPQAEQDGLFLTGLLSLVDVVLEVPLASALGAFALAPEIDQAIRDQDGAYAPLLCLAIALERGEAQPIEALAGQCGVLPERASECYLASLAWALELQR